MAKTIKKGKGAKINKQLTNPTTGTCTCSTRYNKSKCKSNCTGKKHG